MGCRPQRRAALPASAIVERWSERAGLTTSLSFISAASQTLAEHRRRRPRAAGSSVVILRRPRDLDRQRSADRRVVRRQGAFSARLMWRRPRRMYGGDIAAEADVVGR